MPNEKRFRSRMSLSEVMTIAIAFHDSGFRTFKEFYTLQVLPHWKKARQRGLGGMIANHAVRRRPSGKNSMGWHYGFKLHLIINDRGELLAFNCSLD